MFEIGTTTGLTDGQLLERFATRTGEAAEVAFEALVERHGPMVLRACRSILRDEHEAMDAFQATFLILARKGRGLWVSDSLGPWLHRVACRASSKARANASKRRAIELRAAELGTNSTLFDPVTDDLATVLHEELDRLPERFRAAIVLCDLQGHSCEETARRLGCAVGTVGSRLSRGRERLRTRLIRRGLDPTAGLVGIALSRETIAAAVPPALVRTSVRGALSFSTKHATVGASSATAALLAGDVTRSLFMAKIRSIAATLAVACGISLVAGGTIRAFARTQDPAETKPPSPVVKKPPAAEKDEANAFKERHKDYRFATVGNLRPLIEDAKGVRFQSREAILYRDGTVRIYPFDVPARATEPIVPPLRHDGPIREMTILDEAGLLITTSDDSVKVWDALTGEPRKAIKGQVARPLCFLQGEGGGRFTTIDLAGQVVTLWNSKTLEPVGTIRPGDSPRLIGAGVSNDGKTLATIGEDHSVTLRDAGDGKPFATLRPPTPPIARVFVDSVKWADTPTLQLDDPFWKSVQFLIPPEKK